MAGYSSYSFKAVKKKFGLQSVNDDLFGQTPSIVPSDWLKNALIRGDKMATITEKSRSEWIVAPILMEIKYLNINKLSVISGENLDIDKDLSLTGECDFVFSRNPNALVIEAPIFCMIEAEKNDIMGGLGQCIAQMIGAQRLNEQDGIHYPMIYGCVTTGKEWKFLKMEGNLVTIHHQEIYLNEIPRLLGIFQTIIDAF
ncbi:MAG: hypothetical protein RL329_3982 [Bacteroidota bacterium]|jgi:hypothetical protein